MGNANNGKDDISCKNVMDHICENLGEALNSPRCALIKQHLENCESCKKYFHSIESTIGFYKEYNVTISEEAHKKLFSLLGLKE